MAIVMSDILKQLMKFMPDNQNYLFDSGHK
jgi:hypothetical protein